MQEWKDQKMKCNGRKSANLILWSGTVIQKLKQQLAVGVLQSGPIKNERITGYDDVFVEC